MGDDCCVGLAAFLAGLDMFFFATATAGQLYVRDRGGAPGQLEVIGDRALGFSDFAGVGRPSPGWGCL
ncbi:hypothetical protein J0H58_02710 [bacterium]|nr:hypothetical protein [bacterium]